MRKVTKAAATLLLTVPLTIGLGQSAFAAEGPSFHHGTASADAAGATRSDMASGFLGGKSVRHPYHLGYWGMEGPSYVSSDASATAVGASSDVVASGFDANGDAFYTNAHLTANSGGATSSVTHSNS
nr:hypothetical protein OG999_34760 [Streptomyces sp. NBC_00886]